MAGPRRRPLTGEIVARGLAADADGARQLIAARSVRVAGSVADNPDRLVSPAEAVIVMGGAANPLFPSRAGGKLDAALDRFGVTIRAKSCLDAGASTGGFTACLLQRGAAAVTAVDVGYGLIHEKLRGDPRVILRERTNVRSLCDPEGGPADGVARFAVVVADLSFVSLTSVAGTLAADLAAGGADLVLLVKPQFEADRATVSRGRGVVTDPGVWTEALVGVARSLMSQGACIMDAMPSPIRGTKGNVELFLHATALTPARAGWEDRVAAAVDEARGLFGERSTAGGRTVPTLPAIPAIPPERR